MEGIGAIKKIQGGEYISSYFNRIAVINNMIKNYLFFTLIVFTCYSCNSPRYIYSPSPPNNPYFKEKGDSKLAASYSSGWGDSKKADIKNHGIDMQAAYAPGRNWALTAGFFERKERDIFSLRRNNYFNSSIVNYKRQITDFGGGYFISLDRRKTVFFNAYGGIGFGKFSFTDSGIDKAGVNYSRFHNSNITKWFIQPSVNLFADEYFRAAFIAKFSFVHYGNISTSYTNDEIHFFLLDRIRNKTIFYFEPAFSMQFVIPPINWLKVDGWLNFSTNPFKDFSRIQTRNFNASIGLSFDFFKMKKK